ncbi:Rab GDP dissociation inhibitor alpha [Dissophora globulifera]|nr:Rab GDP dissociation inhibitor alpha [Dissophora globulifera]
MDALRSPLMDVLEKRRAKAFLEFVENYSFDNPTTHQGMDIRTTSMDTVFKFFHLQPGTADIIGHGLALYFDDSYLTRPALEAFHRITLYMSSAARWGKSPFLYPLYGLGELHQGFARLSELHGGTTILNSKVDEILYEDGRAVGVRCGDEVAKCSQIVCDPSYAPKKVKKTGQVIRVICLLNEPIPCTDDADSLHLIMPQKQLRRQHDIFIAGTSGRHNMCEDDHYLAIVSTIIETDKPEEEIQPGLTILGDIVHKFVHIYDMYEPTDDGTTDHVFVSKSYDATSHFETVYHDIKDLYKRIVGRELDIKPKQPQEGVQKECVQCLGNRPVFIHEEIS